MRLRNIPNAMDKLTLCSSFVNEPASYRGKWHEYFGNHNPVYLEIGSGRGTFITTLAAMNPHVNYIALEKFPTPLVKLIKKIPEAGQKNLAVISMDAEQLEECFASGEITGIYLNFSDPWPKKRHAKRRLTSSQFLPLYRHVLSDNGILEFKTDNRGLFDFSVESFTESTFTLKDITYDLYNSPLLDGNVQTEYEMRFVTLGNPIHKLIAVNHKTNETSDGKGDSTHEIHTQE